MAEKLRSIHILVIVFALITPIVVSNDDPIPADKNQILNWFANNVQPNRSTLDPGLVQAELNPKIITVRQDGTGNFKTIMDAVNGIPDGNNIRTILAISGGTYFEKISVNKNKWYVTFYGNPNSMPVLVFNDSAAATGSSLASASVAVEGQYFMAANIVFRNTAPRPRVGSYNEQAVAFRVSGDKVAFYNSSFIGFQDTLCDDTGRHFYMNCYIEGTEDFIWGNGKTIFLSTELHAIKEKENSITAHFRSSLSLDEGYSFVHCSVTGDSYRTAFLGRALQPYATVIYSYTDISKVLHQIGWLTFRYRQYGSTVFFREYENTGEIAGRTKFSKNLTDGEAIQFLSLSYIEGSKWLLPPPTF